MALIENPTIKLTPHGPPLHFFFQIGLPPITEVGVKDDFVVEMD